MYFHGKLKFEDDCGCCNLAQILCCEDYYTKSKDEHFEVYIYINEKGERTGYVVKDKQDNVIHDTQKEIKIMEKFWGKLND